MPFTLLANKMQFAPRRSRGVSLLEVLISMFILLFGLVGVASLFPVGKYHVNQAIQYDQAAAIGQRAFEEIRVRGLLRPDHWNLVGGARFADPLSTNTTWKTQAVMFDPIGAAASIAWVPRGVSGNNLRRVTWRDASSGNNMSAATADAIFRSHDDLLLELPSARSTPAIQRISTVEREYAGNYSWAFTAVPAREMGDGVYYVSVVVFRGRDPLGEWHCGDNSSNKLLASYGPGEGQIRLVGTEAQIAKIRIGEWIMLSVPSDNYYRWYKVVSLSQIVGGVKTVIRVQVQGAYWPDAGYSQTGGDKMRASVFGSAVAVYEKVMKIESDSAWQPEFFAP